LALIDASVHTVKPRKNSSEREEAFIMRTDGINDSNWKELYRKAMLETDQAKASQHIHDARNAILGRVEQLLVDPVSGEHKLLKDALRFLQILQNEISAQQRSA
jgi:hypothetical protein